MAGARDAALRALIAFRRDGAWPESALKDALRGMDRREAALATRLCNGCLLYTSDPFGDPAGDHCPPSG